MAPLLHIQLLVQLPLNVESFYSKRRIISITLSGFVSRNANQSGTDDPGQSREEKLAARNTGSPVPPNLQNNMWYSCRRLIYIKTNPKVNSPVGHWPIPESFWPDPSTATLVSGNFTDFTYALQYTQILHTATDFT